MRATGVWLSQGETDSARTSKSGDQEGQAIISAKRIVGRAEALEDVTFYYFHSGPTGEREFAYRIDAKRAVLVPGFWQLEDVVENRPGSDVPAPEDKLAAAADHSATPTRCLSRFASSKTIPFWDPAAIHPPDPQRRPRGRPVCAQASYLACDTADDGGDGADRSCLLPAAGALRRPVAPDRRRRSDRGSCSISPTRMAANLSASGATSPEAAAWCPPLIALFAVLTVIAHAEDG